MFKSSENKSQLDMFSSVSGMLTGKSSQQFSDPKAWHNMFRIQIVERIDEELFAEMFSEKMGAPNASIKILVAMMILKEAFGWSDRELYENCRFNLLVRSALGLFNIHESVPVESTYYLLRKRIHDYHREEGVDLLEKIFNQLTNYQALEFGVSGKSIRMDSKLIGSNIAFSTRYELVHDTLVAFYKEMIKTLPVKITDHELNALKLVAETSGNKVVYRCSREEVKTRLQGLGILCQKVLSAYTEEENKYYAILKRVFDENFRLESNGKAILRPSQEIKSDSVQSPHDDDCAYRNKAGKHVKGYSVNVSETCDDDSLNLITDIQVAPANTSDTEFVVPALKKTQEITGKKPKKLHADGAYNNQPNTRYCKKEGIIPYYTGMAGQKGRYDLIKEEKDNLKVVDTETGEIIPAERTESGKWRIKKGKRDYRYFTDTDIARCSLRKQIEDLPDVIRNKRNNVEATIFHLSHYMRNNKTKYRGLIKNKTWAILRSLWINFRRIIKWMGEMGPFPSFIKKNGVQTMFFGQKSLLFSFFLQFFDLEPILERDIELFEISTKYRKLPFRRGLND